MKMNISQRNIYYVLLLGIAYSLSGCATMVLPDPFTDIDQAAFKTPKTVSGKKLHALPKPMGKIKVALYSFTDQTGQRKDPANGGISSSSAVTQAGAAILMQSLQDSNWFTVLERRGLADLTKERSLFRIANKKKNLEYAPMKTADLLLEGGITGFATNVKTSGSGIEYFGSSLSKQYREDFVTVHLRAVDIASGQVALAVSASRRLLSKEIRAGLFQYIKFKELLGIEKGVTVNEPSHIVVADAIEKAVHDLIIEGIIRGTWKLKNPKDAKSPLIQAYLQERAQAFQANFRKKNKYSVYSKKKGKKYAQEAMNF